MTVFVALQHITEEMGPTVLCPRTHNLASHEAINQIPLELRSSAETSQRFGAIHATCQAGTAVLMDSRLLHCGGANVVDRGSRRRLFYTSWQLPGNTPDGSTYSIRSELQGRLRLSRFLKHEAMMTLEQTPKQPLEKHIDEEPS